MQFSDTFIFIFGIIFGLLITFIFEMILKTNVKWRVEYYEKHQTFLGYHLHHSMYGVAFMLLGVILFFRHQTVSSIFFMGVGVGVIIMHTVSESRFVFIEKELD